MIKYEIISTLSIILNLLFLTLGLFILYKKGGIQWLKNKIFYPQTGDAYAKTRESIFKVIPKQNKIVFLGDSLINRCEWSELFDDINIANRGIEGENTITLLNRLEIITRIKPCKIFLMLGNNDLKNKTPIDSIGINYRKIIDKIKLDCPNTKIYIHSVLPVNTPMISNKINNNDIENLNENLKKIEEENIHYIDVSQVLKDSRGNLDKKYTFDGVHINGNAYLKWKEKIEKYI
jgi:lysophospholipase L1-like esterase